MPEQNATTVPAMTPALTEKQVAEAAVKRSQMERMKAAEPGVAAAPVAKKESTIMLPPARMKGFEYANTAHVVTIESNWTLDDVVKPIFWSSVWQKMRRYDEIAVNCDDGAWWAKLLVTEVGIGYVFVTLLQFKNLLGESNSAPMQFDGYEVRELGPFKKWCVVRTADSVVLKEKSESRRDAEDWLRNYQEQQARSAASLI